MSNRFWTNKTDGVDDIVAEDFNSAFDKIAEDVEKTIEDATTLVNKINEQKEDLVKFRTRTRNLISDEDVITESGAECVNNIFINTNTDSKTSAIVGVKGYKDNVEVIAWHTYVPTTVGERKSLRINITSEIDTIRLYHVGTQRNLYVEFNISETVTELGFYTLSYTVDANDPTTIGGIILSNIQLEKGYPATDYIQPFVANDLGVREKVNNLYDTSFDIKMMNGKYLLYINGTIDDSSDYSVTDFVSVVGGNSICLNNIKITGNSSLCCYDAIKGFISALAYGIEDTHIEVVLPDNARYIRVTSKYGERPTISYKSNQIGIEMNNIKNELKDVEEKSVNGLSLKTKNLISSKDATKLSGVVMTGISSFENTATDGKTEAVINVDGYKNGTKVSSYQASIPTVVGARKSLNINVNTEIDSIRLYHSGSSTNLGVYFDVSKTVDELTRYILTYTVDANNPSTIGGFALSDIQFEKGLYGTPYVEPIIHTNDLIASWYGKADKRIISLFSNATKKPIITFIDDDTWDLNHVRRYKEWCDNAEIKGCLSAITSRLDNVDGLANELLNYEKEGFQIVTHCTEQTMIYHPSERDLSACESDLVNALHRLHHYGFTNYKYWITPYGVHDDDMQTLARKWGMECLVTSGEKGYENTKAERGRYALCRMTLSADDSGLTMAQIKEQIDLAYAENGWVLITTHVYEPAWDGKESRFAELVNYAKTKGFEVRTLADAWRIRKPIYELYEMF